MFKNITVTMLASIITALYGDDEDWRLRNLLDAPSIETVKNGDSFEYRDAQVILELMEANVFTDSLFNKIREILNGGYSYHQSLYAVKKSKDAIYLEFDLDFDESSDSLYLDVHTLEIWKSQGAFIEFLLSR